MASSVTDSIRAANAWGGDSNQPHSFAFVGGRLYFLLNGGLRVADPRSGATCLEQAASAIDRATVKRSAPMSREEELLRERMRSSAQGVSGFHAAPGSETLVVKGEGTIFTLATATGSCAEVPSTQPGARLHSHLSADGAVLGFVRARNVHLVHVESGREVQVSDATGTRLAGEGDFIHQEEFTTYRTFWISPTSGAGGEYRVLYLEMDEAPVHVYHLPNPGIDGTVDPFRYALTGTRNSRVHVMLATVDMRTGRVARRELSKALLPWVEYVPRGGFFPDGNSAWFSVQDRSQMRAAILEVDLSDARFPAILHEESSNIWVNASLDMCMPLHHFGDGSMLVASESVGGFAHLYRLPRHGGKLRAVTAGSWQCDVKERWHEGLNFVWVDEQHLVVYFMGRKDSVLESHLYCASLRSNADPKNVVRLTEAGYDHHVSVSADGQFFVDTKSSLSTPPSTCLYSLSWGTDDTQVMPVEHLVASGAAYAPTIKDAPFPFQPPTLFSITSHGHQLHGVTYFPPDFTKSHQYPTVIYTYGGPHVQLVQNNWALTRGPRSSRWQLLASMGYVVSVLDNRGSINRGLAFEGELRWKMGTVEIDDQVAHVHHLVAEGFTDPRRVAIYGSSYGGYMTLMAMCKRSDVFKLGFSFSPVTDWRAYDTGYTERYMGLPSENPDGYKNGDVIAHASGFPAEPGRLVLFHGGSDENVHFAHTTTLISRLVELGKPYELQLYPEDRHGIAKGAMHAATKMLTHIKTHL